MKEIRPPYDDRISEVPTSRFQFGLRMCFAATAIVAFAFWLIRQFPAEVRLETTCILALCAIGLSFALFGMRR